MTPHLSISSLVFSDGSKIDLAPDDIVVFVGPNNAGKSAALRGIQEKSNNRKSRNLVLFDLELLPQGSSDDLVAWLETNFRKIQRNPENLMYAEMGTQVFHHNAQTYWQSYENGLHELSRFFVYHLTTDDRLKAAGPAKNIALTSAPFTHPIHHLQADDSLEGRISQYFRKAFGEDLVIHRNAGDNVPLHTGQRPIPPPGCDRLSLSYLKAVEELPALHEQGDGMRAFVGVLLHTLVMKHSILLIDEPEAFLHPPQARLLGKLLANDVPSDRQIFLATHSGDFLRGLLESNSQRIRILRIQREGNVNRIAELDNTGIKTVWSDPLLRHSNILDGIFHKRVVICESDSDSRFYSAVADCLDEQDKGGLYDTMFINCGGKDRIAKVVASLNQLSVPISVILDFDVIATDKTLQSIVTALGCDWVSVESDYRLVKAAIEQKKPELNTIEVVREIQEVLDKIQEQFFPKSAGETINSIFKRSSPWATA